MILNPIFDLFPAFCSASESRVTGTSDVFINTLPMSVVFIHFKYFVIGMRAPSFRCTETDDGKLILHYYSDRDGLEQIVIGIVKVGSANQFHHCELQYT